MKIIWAEDAEPEELRWEDNGQVVAIDWADGHSSRYRLPYLRRICPCAGCRDAHASPPITSAAPKSFKILTPSQVQLAKGAATVTAVEPIGNYAICFTWSDGHDDGIYSYRFLRSMCPCLICTAKHEDQPIKAQQELVELARAEARSQAHRQQLT